LVSAERGLKFRDGRQCRILPRLQPKSEHSIPDPQRAAACVGLQVAAGNAAALPFFTQRRRRCNRAVAQSSM